MQNGYIERFNRTYRQDILDAHLFDDIMQVKILTEEWMEDYNHKRPISRWEIGRQWLINNR